MKKTIIISILASLVLTACGDPKQEASEIAQQACIANKNADLHTLKALMNNEMFEINKRAFEDADPMLKNLLKMLNCDLKSTDVLDDGGFVVSFKKHNSYEVQEVDGDLKFQPPVFYCNGQCANQIRRMSTYYSTSNNMYHWCSPCFNALKENQTVSLPDVTVSKKELANNKKKHSEESPKIGCNVREDVIDGCIKYAPFSIVVEIFMIVHMYVHNVLCVNSKKIQIWQL